MWTSVKHARNQGFDVKRIQLADGSMGWAVGKLDAKHGKPGSWYKYSCYGYGSKQSALTAAFYLSGNP